MPSRITKGQVKKLNTPIVVPKRKKKKKKMSESRPREYHRSSMDRFLKKGSARPVNSPNPDAWVESRHRKIDGRFNAQMKRMGLLDKL